MLRSKEEMMKLIGNDPALSNRLSMPLGKDAWKLVGITLSCVEHPAYPYDKGVLAAIREFYPRAVYIRRVWTYKNEAGRSWNIMRHAIGSYVSMPRTMKKDRYVEMPVDADFVRPNQIDVELIYGGDIPFGQPRHPGSYVPFNWGTFYYLQSIYDDKMNEKERWVRFIQGKIEEEARQKEKLLEEIEYARKDVDRWALRKLGEISDVEIEEYVRELRRMRAEQQREFQFKIEQANKKPVRVYLGG